MTNASHIYTIVPYILLPQWDKKGGRNVPSALLCANLARMALSLMLMMNMLAIIGEVY